MATTKIYSLKEFTGSFCGIDFTEGGAADGDMVAITYPNQYVTQENGVDGSVVFSEQPDGFHVEAVITLSQTSGFWALYWAAINAMRLAGGVLTGPFLLKDNGGSQVLACAVGAPKQHPGTNVGKSSASRQLTLLLPNAVENGGGN